MISKWNKYIMKKKKLNYRSAGHAEIKHANFFFNIFNFILLNLTAGYNCNNLLYCINM